MKQLLSILVAILGVGVCNLHAQQIGMATDKGRQNVENQDCCDSFSCTKDHICVVGDGVSGNAGGQTASRTAVETIHNYFRDNHPGMRTDSIGISLTAAIQAAQKAILQRSAADTTLQNRTSNCLIAVIGNKKIYYALVGDCRMYRSTNCHTEQLTKYDSYMDYLITQGGITPKRAKKHPLRRAIFKAQGVEGLTPHLGSEGVKLAPDQCILMCSNGLHTEVKESHIRRILYRSGSNCNTIASQLIDAATRAGGDDITAMVIKAN